MVSFHFHMSIFISQSSIWTHGLIHIWTCAFFFISCWPCWLVFMRWLARDLFLPYWWQSIILYF